VADRLYVVRRPGTWSEIKDWESTSSLPELLGELSFTAYRELGYEEILLVEGPNDVTAFRSLLRKVGMDARFVLLHLGGSSGIRPDAEPQLAEIQRLGVRVRAIVDSEKAAEREGLSSAHTGFRSACEALGISCHILERRAFENYLTERAVKAVKGDKYRALGPYERLHDVDPHWAKTENWRITQAMEMSELLGTDLGDWFAELDAD
jgi:hypothetical protein